MKGICWLVTTRCNMNCPICHGYKKEMQVELMYREKCRIIDSISNKGFKSISFTGGEPLLDKELLDLLKYAKNKGLYVGLSTNGKLLNDTQMEDFDQVVDEISIPLDGSEASIHGFHRGDEKHFQSIIEILKKKNKFSFKIDISTVVSKHNINDLPNMARLLADLYVQRWKILQYYPIEARSNLEKVFSVEKKYFTKKCQELVNILYDIDVFIRPRSKKIMKSYVNLSPSGNILLTDSNRYMEIGSILIDKDIKELLLEYGFNFEVYSKRHFSDQYIDGISV